tara:strand:+ start:3160 stop:4278 length:1119 start_codon:yes stop_codon:yes gene_type:complete
MNVSLFFTYDVSLNDWYESKIFDREISYYKEISDKYSINYTFVTYGGEEDLKFQHKLENIQIIPIYTLQKRFNNKILRFLSSFMTPFKLKKFMKNENIFKTNQLMGSWVPILLKIFLRKKLIVRTGYDILEFSIKEKRGILKIIFYFLLTKITLYFSNKYIVSSENNIHFLKKISFIDNKKIVKVNNWIEESNTNKKYERSKNKILSVGRLETQKNYLNLIKNIKSSNLDLHIIGEGSLREKILEESKNQNVNVELIGKMNFDDLNNLYKKYRYFIIFSKFEGHPKALIEAMSNGCIPIVLEADYVFEIIKHNQNGIILKSEDDEIIKIINFLNENERLVNDLSENAKIFVTNNYSKNKIMKEEINLYNLVS